MWTHLYLNRIDLRVVPVILALMMMGLLVIASYSTDFSLDHTDEPFFTPMVKHQLQWFGIGWVVFLFFAGFDYNKLREWTWFLYLLMILSLIGLFFTDPIQRVQRWYRLPFINISIQPSEYAKLFVVITLSWFLERRKTKASYWSTAFFGGIIVGIPFLLILKQPDLGTALVLFPMTLVMFYFGDIHPLVVKGMIVLGSIALIAVGLIFLGVTNYEDVRPYATKFLKDYQYERLNPNTHHQKAAVTAIAVGGINRNRMEKKRIYCRWMASSALYRLRFSCIRRGIWIYRFSGNVSPILCPPLFQFSGNSGGKGSFWQTTVGGNYRLLSHAYLGEYRHDVRIIAHYRSSPCISYLRRIFYLVNHDSFGYIAKYL